MFEHWSPDKKAKASSTDLQSHLGLQCLLFQQEVSYIAKIFDQEGIRRKVFENLLYMYFLIYLS